jgi:hypothetical protein
MSHQQRGKLRLYRPFSEHTSESILGSFPVEDVT